MIQLVAGLKMMIQLVAGLIQRTGNVKMTRMQSLPPRSSQSWGRGGHRHGNSELEYISVNVLMEVCVLSASKTSKKR